MPNVLDGANKQGLIVFGGERSDDYGMVITEAPSFERGKRKQTIYNIPGRSGAIVVQEDAWEDVPRPYNVFIPEAIEEDSGGNISGTLAERVTEFEAMLNSKKGYQRLEDNFEPDIFRLAYYSGGDGFTNELLTVGRATLNFTCNAKRFLKTGETPVEVSNGDTLNNPTRYDAAPLIKIEVSSPSTITVTIGGATISADVDDYIYIDCDEMNAYRQAAENKNNDVSGSLPSLVPGINTIGITGSPSKVIITPRWYTI